MTTLAEAIARVPHMQEPISYDLPWPPADLTATRLMRCVASCPRCALDRAYKDRERAIDSLIEAAIEAGRQWGVAQCGRMEGIDMAMESRPTPASIREGRADADR